MSLSAAARRKLTKELSQLSVSPPEGIRVVVDESDILSFDGWIQGPGGTPFESGYFRIRFQFSSDYPTSPPKCWFVTKIFHPNVAPSTGEICVSTLKKDWKSNYGISHILVTVKCLLIYPNPESALHEEAGRLLLEQYDDFAKQARLMTSIHAQKRPSVFTTVKSTEEECEKEKASTTTTTTTTATSCDPPPLATSPGVHLSPPTLTKSLSRSSDKDCVGADGQFHPSMPLQPSGISNTNCAHSMQNVLQSPPLMSSTNSSAGSNGGNSNTNSNSNNNNHAHSSSTLSASHLKSASAANSNATRRAVSSQGVASGAVKKRGLKRL